VHTKVPDPFIFGSSADLYCSYSWDRADTIDAEGYVVQRKIYSLKWYKGHEEFFRYVPSEEEPIVKYNRSGVFVDVNRSDGRRVHLWKVDWFTKGEYRCEVTADDFETASNTVQTDVVAVPKRDPKIEGQKTRYSLGETVNLNCTSNASIPETELSWYVNSKEATEDMLIRYGRVREPSNLLTSTLGLRFRIGIQHSRAGSVKVKCVAMLLQVYLKSNEISFEVKRPQNIPVLESREKDGKSKSAVADINLTMDQYNMQQQKDETRSSSNSNFRPPQSSGASGFFESIYNSSASARRASTAFSTDILSAVGFFILVLLHQQCSSVFH